MGRNAVQEKLCQNELFRSVFSIVTSDQNYIQMFLQHQDLQKDMLDKLRKYEYTEFATFQSDFEEMLKGILQASNQGERIPETLKVRISLWLERCLTKM